MEQDKFCVRIPAYGFGQIPAVALLHLSQTGVNLQGYVEPGADSADFLEDIVLEMEDILFCGIGRRKSFLSILFGRSFKVQTAVISGSAFEGDTAAFCGLFHFSLHLFHIACLLYTSRCV